MPERRILWLVRARLYQLGASLLGLFAGAVPLGVQLQVADFVGSLIYFLVRDRREVSLENLRLVYGDRLDGPARRRIARRSLQHLVRVFVEAAWIGRLLHTPRQRARRIGLRGQWEALRADVAAGRGGLIVAAHVGNWEVGAMALRTAGGLPLRVVVRTLDNPSLNVLATQARGGAPVLIRKRGGIRDMLRALRRGDWVAMAVDQNAGYHGEFVPFLGVPASTFPTPAVLADRLDVPIYIGVCVRRPGYAFDVHVERVPEGAPGDIPGRLRRIHDLLEPHIHAAPEQYVWCHRRWKTRPPETQPGPAEPDYGRVLRTRELSRAHRSARRLPVTTRVDS